MSNRGIKVIQNSHTGFTLIELLTAIIMSGMVISIAGFALTQVLQQKRRLSELSVATMELNRAADYIAEDIRDSNKIECHDALVECNIEGYDLPEDATPIIALDSIDENTNNPEKIIYYSLPAEPDSIWKGPIILYRKKDNDPANALIDQLNTVDANLCEGIPNTNLDLRNLCVALTLQRNVEGEAQPKSVTVRGISPRSEKEENLML
jgi:prepilin-type N-terminal cleavage/methylation domain-containing protein